MNHEAGTEEHQGQTKEQSRVLEVPSVPDPNTKDDAPEGRADVVNLGHVTSQRDGQIVNNHDEVLVVHVPTVERHVQGGRQNTRAKDGAASKELVAKEVRPCKVSLPDVEDREQKNTNDDHGDELGAVVFGQAVCCQAEWQQEEHESGDQNEAANDVEFMEVVDKGLYGGPAAWFTPP